MLGQLQLQQAPGVAAVVALLLQMLQVLQMPWPFCCCHSLLRLLWLMLAAAVAAAAAAAAGFVEPWGSSEQRQEGLVVRLLLGASVSVAVEPQRVSK